MLRQERLGRREFRPLLLELCEEPGLAGRRLGFGLRFVRGIERDYLGEHRPGAPALALVPALDLGAQARAETSLGRQLDPVLRGESARQLRPRDEAALDDRLAEAPAALLLTSERSLELLARQEALLDEDPPERTPGDAGRFHSRYIDVAAPRVKDFVRVGTIVGMRVEIHYCPV